MPELNDLLDGVLTKTASPYESSTIAELEAVLGIEDGLSKTAYHDDEDTCFVDRFRMTPFYADAVKWFEERAELRKQIRAIERVQNRSSAVQTKLEGMRDKLHGSRSSQDDLLLKLMKHNLKKDEQWSSSPKVSEDHCATDPVKAVKAVIEKRKEKTAVSTDWVKKTVGASDKEPRRILGSLANHFTSTIDSNASAVAKKKRQAAMDALSSKLSSEKLAIPLSAFLAPAAKAAPALEGRALQMKSLLRPQVTSARQAMMADGQGMRAAQNAAKRVSGPPPASTGIPTRQLMQA